MSLTEAKKRIIEAQKSGASTLDLSDCGLQKLPIKEIGVLAAQLTFLNISQNNIGNADAISIGQKFKKLTNLIAWSNNIGDEGVKAISENLKNLISLDVWGNSISDKGVISISHNLISLQTLDIGSNGITDDGLIAISEGLKSLRSLFLSYNKITDIGVISICQNLKDLLTLDIGYNNITNEGILQISQNLKKVSSLDIGNNEIDEIGAAIISQNLNMLVSLNIECNKIGDEGALAISQNLRNLSSLSIGGNKISAKGALDISEGLKNLSYLSIVDNQIGDEGASAVSRNLRNLFSLFISKNQIGDEGVLVVCQNLKNLSLFSIADNKISIKGIVAISQNLKNLSILDIRGNKIGDEGALVISQNLKNLSSLDIRDSEIGDKGIKAIYEAFKEYPVIRIFIDGNKPESIPRSAIDSWQNLKQYFSTIAPGKKTINLSALNILLLGNTFSGKSSLQQFYLNDGKKFTDIPKEKRTWGITHKTVNSNLSTYFRLSFWDFGGQEYFHGTHRLFIGGRNSVYLVLWEQEYEAQSYISSSNSKPLINENGDDCYPAAYWLGTIRHFEKEADLTGRVMVIQSKIDQLKQQTQTWPTFFATKRFGLHPGNCFNLSARAASDKGTDETRDYYQALWAIFKDKFEQLIVQQRSVYKFNEDILQILGKKGLIKWRVEKGLSLYRTDFLKLCHEFYEGADDFIMQYLQDCGEVLLFNDNEQLKDKVFIYPEKLLNSIYNVLNKKVKDEGGIFNVKEIKGNRDLLDVMLEMDLIFEHPSKKGEYIAPQFMNENAEISKLLGHLRKLLKIAFSLRFPDFMPRGCITRFIAKKGKISIDGVFWKYGVMYQHKTSEGHDIKVLVEADENNRFIRVYADDNLGKYEALKEVFNNFALYESSGDEGKKSSDISDEKNLSELRGRESNIISIPPPAYLELSADGQNFAAIDEIGKAIDANASKVKSIGDGYMPLASIFYVLLNKITAMPKKIFFSYSRYDREYRDEFEVHFSTLKRQGLIATWYDGIIEPGADANAEIMKELHNADIILCLLSPQFMANDYIWNIEMAKAKAAKKTIMPISIRACDYKKYFADYFGEDKQGFLTQKQFDKGQNNDKIKERDIIWIASEQHPAKRDEYYNYIVEGLKRIIER